MSIRNAPRTTSRGSRRLYGYGLRWRMARCAPFESAVGWLGLWLISDACWLVDLEAVSIARTCDVIVEEIGVHSGYTTHNRRRKQKAQSVRTGLSA